MLFLIKYLPVFLKVQMLHMVGLTGLIPTVRSQTLDGTKRIPPQRTTLTLFFKEIEIMTREKILEGF